MNHSKSWDATSLGWLIKGSKMDQPKPEPVGVFFGFIGMPATITVTKADGTKIVDSKIVVQPEQKEPQNGN